MAPAHPLVATTSTQAWRLIETDYTLRLSLVAHEWAEGHQLAKNILFADAHNRGNPAYLGPAWAKMEIADADKRAEWAYKTCCEIWEIQGRTKSRVLFRGIFDWCLKPIFATRKGCFESEFELHQTRTGRGIPQSHSTLLGDMTRQIGKLLSKWSTRLEIASRNAEYQEQLLITRGAEIQIPAPSSINGLRLSLTSASDERRQSLNSFLTVEQGCKVALTHTWNQLAGLFGDIQAKVSGQAFSASYMPTEGESNAFIREWILGGNPACRLEFENSASIAARKFGYLQREGATDYWLDCIREWMQAKGLDKDKTVAFRANVPTGEALDILKIAEMSARFCTNLMVRGTPESAVPMPSRPSEPSTAPITANRPTRSTRKAKTPNAVESKRRGIILGAIQANDKGLRYCKTVDARKLAIPTEWSEKGCPKTYTDAYKAGEPWRKRIQDEKSRCQRKYGKPRTGSKKS